MIAHTTAYTHGRDWLDGPLAGVVANRALVGELLSEHLPRASWTLPQDSYLGWIDLRAYGLEAAGAGDVAVAVADLSGPARFFLDEARAALSSGHVFGPGGRGHVRLNFATSQARLTQGLTAMGQALRHSRLVP